MRTYLLPKNGQFYKANLHSHSTVSDGKLTPAEMKDLYKRHGYSVLAYTDHELMVPHPELTDEEFVALTGVEFMINTPTPHLPYQDYRDCHLNFIALEPTTTKQPCYHRTLYIPYKPENRVLLDFDENEPDFWREPTPACINLAIQKARAAGFYVIYNHPVWSDEGPEQYLAYKGMHAMEITNYSSVLSGFDEYSPIVYDDMLKNGQRIHCVAADDNHNTHPEDSVLCDSFGGFVMIKAETLDYRTITKALEDGHFYASQGPEIDDLYLEDGMVHIKTSPARKIIYSDGGRWKKSVHRRGGESLTEAVFPLNRDMGYFRITVEDDRGLHANTNAYFFDELTEAFEK